MEARDPFSEDYTQRNIVTGVIADNRVNVDKAKEVGLNILKTTSGGSRPGHRVSGTRSKFPNLNENGQKYHFFCEVFLIRNLVNILPRSATDYDS